MEILTLSEYLKREFGQKVYKLSLSSGCTCPNRDGTIGTGGCTFCSEGRSGEFAQPFADENSIGDEIERAKALVRRKLPANAAGADEKYIAYFQSYTNTYGDTDRLTRLYRKTMERPDIVALSVGTRPDCLEDDKIRMLSELNQIKPVWVELGLQTIHERTARYIRRGYDLPVFETAVSELRRRGIDVIVHTILCLPGETKPDMLQTIQYLNRQDIQGIKLQLLHILKDTDLAEIYASDPFPVPDPQEYYELLGACISHMRPDIVIHRLTGDGPKELLIAPLWTCNKRQVLNQLQSYFKTHDIWQGKEY